LGVGSLIFAPILIAIVALPNILLGTLATVYHSTVWTLAYRELRTLDAVASLPDTSVDAEGVVMAEADQEEGETEESPEEGEDEIKEI
jgi:hypothetical protein